MRVIVLGANGRLGREVVRHVVARGHKVTAFVRRPVSGVFDNAVDVCLGDARKREDLTVALAGQDVVVNAIGSGTLRKNDVESSTTAAAVTAAQKAGVSRYIGMSAGMVALKSPLFRYVLIPLIFRNLNKEHLRVEELVRSSPLKWTIVRPPRLTSRSAKGFRATPTLQSGSFSLPRADVGAFIADEIDKNAHVRKTVHLS